MKCPCCGTLIEHVSEVVWDRKNQTLHTPYGWARFTHIRTFLFDVLWRSKPEQIAVEALIAVLWRGPQGPPLGAENNVRVQASKLRQQLGPLGIVLAAGEKGYPGYHLVITTPSEAAILLQKIKMRSGNWTR